MSERRGVMASPQGKGLLMRVWEILGFWPRITDPALESRLEHFILCATDDELFEVQKVVFQEATPYLAEDPRVCGAMDALSGRSIGLVIEGCYLSTVTLEGRCFNMVRGIRGDIPRLAVRSRRDYADTVLSRRDPFSMYLKGRIKIKHTMTLVKWFLPHMNLLMDRSLIEKYLGYQPEVEAVLDASLKELGY